MSERYTSIDMIKGFGIFSMVLMHGLMQQIAQFDGSIFIPTMANLPPFFFILLIPLAILGLLGSGFVFLTCVTITTQMWILWQTNRKKIPSYLLSRILFGFCILLFSRISYILIGLFTQQPLDEYLQSIFWNQLVSYNSQALDAIVWAGIIVPVLLFIVFRIIDINHPWRISGFFVFLAVFSLGISPLIISIGEFLIEPIRSSHYYVLEFFLSKIIYGRFKIAQTIAYGLISVPYGILFITKQPFKIIARLTFGIFSVCFVTFLIWALVSPDFIQDFASEDVPLPLQILALGSVLYLVLYFVKQHQFCKKEEIRIRHAKRSTWLRRYSIVSLTAFVWGTTYANIIYAIFTAFWGSSVDRTSEQATLAWSFFQIISFIGALFLAWELLLRLWEKIRFVMSLEWWMHIIFNLIYRKKSPYDPKQIVYGPNQSLLLEKELTSTE